MENIKKLFQETKKLADTFDGWLTEREEKFLFLEALRSSSKGVILEIGSWQGKSTTYLARGASLGKNENKIYAIDPHVGSIEQKHQLEKLENKSSLSIFKKNIKKAEINNIVVPIIKKSQDAVSNWEMPISFLWIDGDHHYKVAKSDFNLYSPFLIENSIVAFHDATQNDVPRVVFESFKQKGVYGIGLVDSIAYAKFKKDARKNIKDYLILYLIKLYPSFRKLKIFKPFKVGIKRFISKV